MTRVDVRSVTLDALGISTESAACKRTVIIDSRSIALASGMGTLLSKSDVARMHAGPRRWMTSEFSRSLPSATRASPI